MARLGNWIRRMGRKIATGARKIFTRVRDKVVERGKEYIKDPAKLAEDARKAAGYVEKYGGSRGATAAEKIRNTVNKGEQIAKTGQKYLEAGKRILGGLGR